MYRVCTYPDPFNISNNKELWSLMTKSPHFCASQTLVQGLNRHYKKSSFDFIQTLQTFIDNMYSDFNNNFDNDIKLYLTISDYIKNLQDETLKSSLKFNIAQIVESIKLLLIMRSDSEMFDKNNLTFEQKEVLKIYNYVCSTDLGKLFEKYDTFKKDDIKKVLDKCLLDDINGYIQREKNSSEIICKDLSESKENLLNLKKEYQLEASKINIFLGGASKQNYLEKIEEINGYLKLIEKGIDFQNIVIHGVHKITPLMYFLFKILDNLEINVIFVINYMQNYPEVCKTWHNVYAFTKCKFEYVSDLPNIYNDIGYSLGGLFENHYSHRTFTNKLIKFKNLTHFTDDVSNVYGESKKSSKSSDSVLSNMKVQYYSVDSNSSNKILKIYYPEQFGSKHFLSYPIGQFILNLYNMWDSKNKQLKLSFTKLYECINSGLFLKSNTSKMFDICKKVSSFYPEEMTIDVFKERTNELKKNLHTIAINNDFNMLKYLSFYNIDNEDICLLEEYINSIETICNILFAEENVNYKKHFNKLIEIVSGAVDNENISQIELDLIKEITNRLNVSSNHSIEGNVEDIKEAIFYYLSAVKEFDSSNWIVRGFDQIDGGVLLSRTSQAKKYHFACLSNNHLCGKRLKELPYPLTLEMFKNYEESDSAISVMYECYKEERNYLRFYLFYALMFTQKEIELSYIENEQEDEISLPYYPLKTIGVEEVEKEESLLFKLEMEKEDENKDISFDINCLNYNDLEIFSICPYKFFLTKVLKNKIIYNNDYHIKYFCVIFFTTYFSKKYKDCKFSQVEKDIDKEIITLKPLFSFLIDIEFFDIVRKLKEDMKKSLEDEKITLSDEKYINRKINFLFAQWRARSFDGIDGEKQMIFPEDRVDSIQEEIVDYINKNSTHNFEVRKKYPYYKICENCNYSDVCLRQYYEVLENEYNDAVDSEESE